MNERQTYQIHSIGTIRRNKEGVHLEIEEAYRPALRQLDHFSHVMVLWWADRFDNQE